MKLITKWGWLRLVLILVLLVLGFAQLLKMPGKSYQGKLIPLTKNQLKLRAELSNVVHFLSVTLGKRSYLYTNELNSAANFIETSLSNANFSVSRQEFFIRKHKFYNIIGEKKGKKFPDKILVVGAHYDTVLGTMTPGANDNGSGAALLALANIFSNTEFDCTLRFVGFVNEEPPFFHTEQTGSLVYAKKCKSLNEKIIGMLSLETIGYYTDAENSQKYPKPFNLFYPSQGNFITFVGNVFREV
ncbi:MAG: M28 family peptidase [Alphaproteobacteria bacterium]